MEKIKTIKLKEIIQKEIRNYIFSNDLKAGERIPTEKELEKRLGISRTAIRESLNGLEFFGILKAIPGYGRIITEFSFKSLLDNLLPYAFKVDNQHKLNELYNIRSALEIHFIPQILSLSSEDEGYKQIMASYEELKTSIKQNELDNIIEKHMLFHSSFYTPINNMLAQLIKIFLKMQEDFLKHIYSISINSDKKAFLASHTDLIDAVKKKDRKLLTSSIKKHFVNAENLFGANKIIF